jgi:type I restriction enzyme S subunit
MNPPWDVPSAWIWVTVDDIATVIGGGTPPAGDPSNFSEAEIPWLTPADLSGYKGNAIGRGARALSAKGLASSSAKLLPAGSVLYTSRAPIGYCVVAANPIATNQGFKSLVLGADLSPFFLRHYLLSIKEYAEQQASGTTFLELSGARMKELLTPVAPLNEQKRIVAKIEALQARSDAAKEALDAIPPLLEKFRQSVLAAAFRGDLTKKWREAHPDAGTRWREDVPGGNGHAGALTRRGRLWGAGTTSANVRPEWGEIPESWQWVQVRDLNTDAEVSVQIGPMSMKSAEFVEGGVTVLNVGCVQWGQLDLTKANYLPEDRAADFGRYRVEPGDVMFTRSGTVGRSAVVPEGVSALMTFHLLRVRTTQAICVPQLVYFAFQGCPAVLDQVGSSAIGATRQGFNTRLLEEMWIPLPPPPEQRAMLTRLDEVWAFVEGIEAAVRAGTIELHSLNQSILAKAFRGELVPQDPNNEPASVLLERIRREREAVDPRAGKRRAGAVRETDR